MAITSASTNDQLDHSLDILQVSADGSWSDIQAQYRQLVQQWHPDRHVHTGQDTAQAKFIEINSAFNLLRNYYRSTGSIPQRNPSRSTDPLFAVKQSHHRKSQANRAVLSVCVAGIAIILTIGAILWSIDSRTAKQNRDRARMLKSSTAYPSSSGFEPALIRSKFDE